MNGPCDLTSWRLDASDLALAFEWTRHLDAKVDIHRLVPTFWVVIKEQIVSRTQSAIRLQERPHLIERRLPCSGDTADGHRGPDCCHRLCLCSFHRNIIIHRLGPSAEHAQEGKAGRIPRALPEYASALPPCGRRLTGRLLSSVDALAGRCARGRWSVPLSPAARATGRL